MSNFLDSIVLGLIHGLTEFFPIGQLGHLFLAKKLLNINQPSLLYVILLQLAALLSILIVFHIQIAQLLRAILRIPSFCKNLFQKGHLAIADDDEVWTCILILIVTIVTSSFGLFYQSLHRFDDQFWFESAKFFITGIILYSTKNLMLETSGAKQKKEGKFVSQITIKDAIAIGIVQTLSILFGISRSGMAVSASLWLRINRKVAAEFSFLILVPIIIGVMIVESRHLGSVTQEDLSSCSVGFFVSLIVGLISLKYILQWIRKGKLHYFAYYCWTMGLVTMVIAFRK